MTGYVWMFLALLALWGGLAGRFRLRVNGLWRTILATPPAPVRTDLPDPVRAFALRGLAGETPARALTLRQRADFRLKHLGPLRPLPSRQAVAAARPGFVWYAVQWVRAGLFHLRVFRLPLFPAFAVADTFVDGKGWLGARLLAVFPVADLTGAEADRAEAMRYLAELPWCPDAILTNPSLRWRMEGPERVHVSLDTSGGPAEVTFGLDAAGDVATMTARERPAEPGPGGKPVLREWRGAFSDYGMVGPRRIPRAGEVGYLYDEGYEAYWIGRIERLEAHN